jgi:hypothetical protein
MRGKLRIDKFRRRCPKQDGTSFFLDAPRPGVANRVIEYEFFEAKHVECMIRYRRDRFTHQALAPVLPRKPKSSVLRFSLPPQLNSTDHFAAIGFKEDSPGPTIQSLFRQQFIFEELPDAIFWIRSGNVRR